MWYYPDRQPTRGLEMDAERLPKTLRKYAHLIQSVEDYRKSEDTYWVHLVEGWKHDETHSICESGVTECAKALRYVERCTDPECCRNPVG